MLDALFLLASLVGIGLGLATSLRVGLPPPNPRFDAAANRSTGCMQFVALTAASMRTAVITRTRLRSACWAAAVSMAAWIAAANLAGIQGVGGNAGNALSWAASTALLFGAAAAGCAGACAALSLSAAWHQKDLRDRLEAINSAAAGSGHEEQLSIWKAVAQIRLAADINPRSQL